MVYWVIEAGKKGPNYHIILRVSASGKEHLCNSFGGHICLFFQEMACERKDRLKYDYVGCFEI
jgi:hypothetical protein